MESLSLGGGPNLWGGLQEALNVYNLEEDQHCNIILQTDGQPNIHPPRDEGETLQRYKEHNPHIKDTTISTFGFGYNIKSKLLQGIAEEGKGHYCFIPDSSFVGTVFVNATANILATALPASTLHVEGEIVEDLSGLKGTASIGGATFELPPLIYGQTLDILVKRSEIVMYGSMNATLKDAQGHTLYATRVSKPTMTLRSAHAPSSSTKL